MKKGLKTLHLFAALAMLVSCSSGETPTVISNGADENDANAVLTDQGKIQTDFEESYILADATYETGGKFALSTLMNIGMIAAGIYFKTPTAVVSGVTSFLSSIGECFHSDSGPTIANVMNKLKEMDGKLNTINDKLDQNFNQLETQTVAIEAAVDKVLMENQEAAIMSFHTDYEVPIQNFQRDLSDYYEQSYKTYIASSEEVTIYLYKDDATDKWAPATITEEGQEGQTKITFTISDFTNAKESVEKNYNTVTSGFVDRFCEDLDEAILKVSLPNGLEKKDFRDYVQANVVEHFTQKYFQDNHDKALEIRNAAINFAQQFEGEANMANRYIARLEYMFNFAGELKEYATDACANLLHKLDLYTCLAAQACLYAEVNQEPLRDDFIPARENIQNAFKAVKELNDNYSFITHTVLNGAFYRSKFETSYTNIGNNCQFHASFKFEKVSSIRISPVFQEDDVNAHNYVDVTGHLRIATRWSLLRGIGMTTSTSYIAYLSDKKILETDSYWFYQSLLNNHWISDDAFRIFTGASIRDMNSADTGFSIVCNDTGNPKGDHFTVGWTGVYQGKNDADCWSGKIAETYYIDGYSGTLQNSNRRMAAYATYNQSKWWWSNDEHWSFVDNPSGNYFFMVENVAA